MEKQEYHIECGRCGETRLERLTEHEAQGISDGIRPVFRLCVQCGRTTGWIEARNQPGSDLPRRATEPATSSRAAERFVLSGQERIATQSERDEVNEMLRGPAEAPTS